MDRRMLELLCTQETKWKGDLARILAGGYKMLHVGGDRMSNVVDIIVTKVGDQQIVRVQRRQEIIMGWMLVTKQLVLIMFVYEINRNGRARDKCFHRRTRVNGG